MNQQMSSLERYERGLVLKQVQMFEQALEDFREATHDPQYAAKAHVQMALCLKASGRQEEAVAAFRQSLKSRAFSLKERMHIVYLLGQTLESLGRYADTLEAYEWIRKEDPRFQDVAQRIQRLSSGRRGSIPKRHWLLEFLTEQAMDLEQRLKPHMLSCLEQIGQRLGRGAERLKRYHWFGRRSAGSPHGACRNTQPRLAPKPSRQPSAHDRRVDTRRHVRVPVRLRSAFSSKGRVVAGEGELRDLSPWGCRVTSAVAVPVGADLECCIFPQNEDNPFIIEGATVRWISSREFGLAFTKVRPGVQRQIAQLCRTRAA